MRVAALLLAYALVLGGQGAWLLRRAAWVDRAPWLGIAAWQALSASALLAVVPLGISGMPRPSPMLMPHAEHGVRRWPAAM